MQLEDGNNLREGTDLIKEVAGGITSLKDKNIINKTICEDILLDGI